MYTLLTSPNCRWCVRAKLILEEKGIPYTVYDLSDPENSDRREALVEAGLKTVPQIFDASGVHIGGHDALVAHLTLT